MKKHIENLVEDIVIKELKEIKDEIKKTLDNSSHHHYGYLYNNGIQGAINIIETRIREIKEEGIQNDSD